MKIDCEYPNIILNPNFKDLVLRGFTRYEDNNGRIYEITDKQIQRLISDDELPFRYFSGYERNDSSPINLPRFVSTEEYKSMRDYYHKKYMFPVDDYDEFSLINPRTGEIVPLFMLVPCNHCVICHLKKVLRYQRRCQLEAMATNIQPFFLTLTYDGVNYPANPYDLEFVTREIQNFNKRLRKYLSIAGLYTDYRYFFVSEYGSKFGRLHYHAIIFNTDKILHETIDNPYKDRDLCPKLFRFTDYCRKAWKKGFVKVMETDQVNGAYVMKYIGKQIGKGKQKILKSKSLGKGSILEKLYDIRKFPNVQEFTFGSSIKIPVDKYISDIAYPNHKRTLSKDFRDLLQETYEIYKVLDIQKDLSSPLLKEFYTFSEYFLNRYKIPIELLELNEIRTFNYRSFDGLVSEFIERLDRLDKYHYDYHYIKYLDGLHSVHVCASNFRDDTDIAMSKYTAQKFFDDLYEKENDLQ